LQQILKVRVQTENRSVKNIMCESIRGVISYL